MGFLTKLLRREAEVVLEERYGRAVLGFRCGGAVPYGALAPRWPELEALRPFVADPDRLANPVPEDRLPDLLTALAGLAGVPRLSISVADGARMSRLDAAEAADAPEPAAPEEAEAAAPGAPADAPAVSQAELETLRAAVDAGQYPDAGYPVLLAEFSALAREGRPECLARMMDLWRRYIDRVPELAGAPARWIWDFIQVRETDVTPEALLEKLPGLPDPVVDAALTALERSGAPLRLPPWALERLSGQRLAASRFCRSFPDPAALDALFTDAVAAVDAALRATEGEGLLSARCIARLRTQEVAAFRGMADAEPLSYTLRLRLFHKNPRLQTYLRLLLRYIENGLRARYRYSGRLQGELPDETTCAAVDAFLSQLPPVGKPGKTAPPEAPAPRRRIALNMADVARLRADSDATRAALLAAVAKDAWPEAEGDDEEPGVEATASAELAEAALPVDAPSPWREFLARADAAALRAILEGPEALRDLAASRREMPDRLLDALNEVAADTLGDLIADADGVFEEYREALETWAK